MIPRYTMASGEYMCVENVLSFLSVVEEFLSTSHKRNVGRLGEEDPAIIAIAFVHNKIREEINGEKEKA